MSRRKTSPTMYMDCIGKGAFIRMKGREAWERVKRIDRNSALAFGRPIHKEGKREYITRHAFEDKIWTSKAFRPLGYHKNCI
jgi:hypothetical protein